MRQSKSFLIKLVVLSTAIVVVGCATAHKITKVTLGMTKDEVIEVMGKPVSTSAQGEVEYLNYALAETDDDAYYGWTKPYFVRLINGRVESFGRTGDFDSTKTPTVRLETDENIKQDVKVRESSDLYTELTKLKELKDTGIITEQEFEAQKKELLEKY